MQKRIEEGETETDRMPNWKFRVNSSIIGADNTDQNAINEVQRIGQRKCKKTCSSILIKTRQMSSVCSRSCATHTIPPLAVKRFVIPDYFCMYVIGCDLFGKRFRAAYENLIR